MSDQLGLDDEFQIHPPSPPIPSVSHRN